MKNASAKFFALVSACALLTACFGRTSTENAAEKMLEDSGHSADVQMNADGTMKITTDEGTATTSNEMPPDWPEDVPEYPGAMVVFSGSANPADGSAGTAVVMSTTDTAAQVEAFYQAQLEGNGWTLSGTMDGGGTKIMSATKAPSRTVSVMIVGGADGKTNVTVGIEDTSR